jgi:hypothetical protein
LEHPHECLVDDREHDKADEENLVEKDASSSTTEIGHWLSAFSRTKSPFDHSGNRPEDLALLDGFVIERKWNVIMMIDGDDRFDPFKRTSLAQSRQRERKRFVTNLSWAHNLSSKLVELDRSSLPVEVKEGLGRRSAVAEAIL